MRLRNTGILLLVFLALLGYVYFVEMRKSPAAAPVDKSTWVLTIAADDVQSLNINDRGQSISFNRSGDTWYVGEAGGNKADAGEVGGMVASLANLQATRALTQTDALSSYGLDKPAMTVVLGLTSGQQEQLAFGDKNLQGTQYYVLKKGAAPVYLVYSALGDDLRNLVSNPPFQQAEPPASPAPATTPKP
jgi:hypothetical protein